MEDCIFCKIIKNEIPCEKIYEDEKFLSFLDIQPVSHGHILIIPKEHVIWMQEASDETISEVFKLSKKIMTSMIKGMNCDYISLSVSGTDIPHFHIHLIPRYLNDGLAEWPKKEYQGEEKKEVAQKITQEL